jgi:hypothetical protein
MMTAYASPQTWTRWQLEVDRMVADDAAWLDGEAHPWKRWQLGPDGRDAEGRWRKMSAGAEDALPANEGGEPVLKAERSCGKGRGLAW